MTQVLQGMGGGIAATTAQLFAQGSVPHQGEQSSAMARRDPELTSCSFADLATVTAFVLLLAEIGNAVGTAIATAVWKQVSTSEPGATTLLLTFRLPDHARTARAKPCWNPQLD